MALEIDTVQEATVTRPGTLPTAESLNAGFSHGSRSDTIMAKKRQEPTSPATTVTADRAARLYKLLNLLGQGPQTRAGLTRRLKLEVRGFYRDLEVLRIVGIAVDLVNGRYVLLEDLAGAIARLPFPDPGLTLGEARLLAKGRSRAHRKLKDQLEVIIN